MKVRVILCGLLMAASGLSLGAGTTITMKVSPEVAFAPADLVVRTNIEADAGNRAIEIVAESADFYRSSLIELQGDRAPRTSVFEFRNLPRGEYQVMATLIGEGGEPRARVRQRVRVLWWGDR